VTRWLDDYEPGLVERFGAFPVEREAIFAFARLYDPQDFHLDDAAAAANPLFGRLAASGWQSAGIAMRLLVEHRRARGDLTPVLAGAGVDELRWLKPVYAGDTLSLEWEVLEVTPSRSKPDRGTMRSRSTLHNQHGERVMTFVATELIRRRVV